MTHMTEDEYNLKVEETLADIPEEFHSPFEMMAWERGHSSGYNEVILELQNLVDELQGAIHSYGLRLSKKD